MGAGLQPGLPASLAWQTTSHPPGQVRGTWGQRRGGQGSWQIPRAPFPSLAPGHPALLGAWPRNRAFLEEEDRPAGSAAGQGLGLRARSLGREVPPLPHSHWQPPSPLEQARLGWAWLPLLVQRKSGTHRPLSQGQTWGSDLGSQNPGLGVGVGPDLLRGCVWTNWAPRCQQRTHTCALPELCTEARAHVPHPWGQALCTPRSPPPPAFTEGCAPLVVPICSPTGQGVTGLCSLGGQKQGSLGGCEPAPPRRNTE